MTKYKTFTLALVLLICTLSTYGQVLDDFSDGDFTQNPTWTGTPDAWGITNLMLRSSSTFTGAPPFYLSTASVFSAGIWRSYFRYASLVPTSGNHAEFWVMADNSDLSVVQNGYFVRIGDTDKDICLYKLKAGILTKIIDGPNQLVAASSNSGYVRLTRTAGGQFALWAIHINASQDSVLMGTTTDNELVSSSHLGFLVRSTASNYGKHYFDNIRASGQAVEDDIPPTLLSANLSSPTEIDLLFDENLDKHFAELSSNYSLNPTISVLTASLLSDNKTLRLLLGQSVTAGILYTISAVQSKDTTGNIRTAPQSKTLTYLPDVPYRSIVVNEIMSTPSSTAGTTGPQVEWIELHNPGSAPVTINSWTIRDASIGSPKIIPTSTIPAYGYIILVSAANAGLFPGITVAQMPLPSLNNDRDSIVLADSHGNPVDMVLYDDTWYRDPVKKLGGYSLEQISPLMPCMTKRNWIGATGPSGGSPGIQNTYYSTSYDVIPPDFLSITVPSSNMIYLEFSETLDTTVSGLAQLYSIQPGPATVLSAKKLSSDSTVVVLILSEPLIGGTTYTITVQQSKDLYCNVQSQQQHSFIYTPVSVDKPSLNNESWQVFPNPASSVIRISSQYKLECTVEIINAIGQLIYSIPIKDNQEISVSHLLAGMYYFRFSDAEGIRTGSSRFIKN